MIQAASAKSSGPNGVAGDAPPVRRGASKLADNRIIAAKLDEYAGFLEQQEASPFRVRAYDHAARVLDGLDRPIADILADQGQAGLMELPGVGVGIAAAVMEIARTGRWTQLERLRGASSPEALFETLPGVGPRLARRLADDLHLETLEDLETAAVNGDLNRSPGWGRKRVAMIRAVLAEHLARPRFASLAHEDAFPSVDLILEIDREYRERAAEGALKRITPRRLNPAHEAWLPVLHAERGGWSFTALFSNTARAHQLGRTRDWVVIHYQSASLAEGQCTVVTERTGRMAGRRVIRGRETECQ